MRSVGSRRALKPGFVAFDVKNAGTQDHGTAIVRIKGKETAAELAALPLDQAIQKVAIIAPTVTAAPGKTIVNFALITRPGRYGAVDPAFLTQQMYSEFTVKKRSPRATASSGRISGTPVGGDCQRRAHAAPRRPPEGRCCVRVHGLSCGARVVERHEHVDGRGVPLGPIGRERLLHDGHQLGGRIRPALPDAAGSSGQTRPPGGGATPVSVAYAVAPIAHTSATTSAGSSGASSGTR